ncbi:hypothetical protein SAMN04488589_2462 [Methanolobus vulcani]|uniref:Uncharacterized protein n=1 Tax=Methanolobus vulcani TaxID=38026 RepID=A0A7Z7FDK7_9EURY|nr:hypothetical protein [Methanolobus sp.]SDG22297.1 hypothetical protein SAMN04488589_2462 [Methanolobus vulcani]
MTSYGSKPLYFNWKVYKKQRPYDFFWKLEKRYDYLFFKFIKKDGSVYIDILLYKLFFILN